MLIRIARHLMQRAGDSLVRAGRRLRDDNRSRAELGFAARREFRKLRDTPGYQAAYDKPDPLVSICIATYNRATLVTERAIASALAQTHRNIEVVVVGDACTDDTAARIAAIGDARVRFENRAERGRYPDNPHHRWLVAGSVPMNRCLDLARGDFITHLDDDDEHPPERVEKLLAFMRDTRADLAWHPFALEKNGAWGLVASDAGFAMGKVTTGSVFYHRALAPIHWDVNAWRLNEPGDWNRFRRIRFLGARIREFPEPLLRHYAENSSPRP